MFVAMLGDYALPVIELSRMRSNIFLGDAVLQPAIDRYQPATIGRCKFTSDTINDARRGLSVHNLACFRHIYILIKIISVDAL